MLNLNNELALNELKVTDRSVQLELVKSHAVQLQKLLDMGIDELNTEMLNIDFNDVSVKQQMLELHKALEFAMAHKYEVINEGILRHLEGADSLLDDLNYYLKLGKYAK